METSWNGKHGAKRVHAEFMHLSQLIESGQMPQVHGLELVADDLMVWRFGLKNFDDSIPGGRALNKDLEQLCKHHGQDHLLMEISFEQDYPTRPFFLRMVSPRCIWYTGHVTAGGSVCIQSLTLSGGPESWQPSFSAETILNVVIANMIDCEVVQIKTLHGPGGLTGPLRIDMNNRYCGHVMQDYSIYEAKSAFARALQNHSHKGW